MKVNERLRMNSDSFDKDFCLQKVDSAISMVERLIDGDYPHLDSRDALVRILEVYRTDRDLLLSIDSSAAHDTVLEYCRRVNINLVRFKEFLGLLLRSSNIRNAFELYFPIKILSLELLEQRTAVVLSSEWDFSPYTYPVALPELPEFIFIGIPASESQNPLILPLAGHELGHVVWRRKGGKKEFDPIIRSEIIRLYKERWPRFTHSFRYLIAPSLGHHRSVNYPRLHDRAEYMARYGKELGLPEITGYAESFSELDYTLAPGEALILEVADETTKNLHTKLPAIVDKYRGKAEPFSAGLGDEPGVKRSLLNLVPAASAKAMTAVVNAAWEIRLEIDKWAPRTMFDFDV
jgi:hypothetical protein